MDRWRLRTRNLHAGSCGRGRTPTVVGSILGASPAIFLVSAVTEIPGARVPIGVSSVEEVPRRRQRSAARRNVGPRRGLDRRETNGQPLATAVNGARPARPGTSTGTAEVPVEVSGMNRGTDSDARAGRARHRRPCPSQLLGHPDLFGSGSGTDSIAGAGHGQLVHVRHLGLGYGRAEHPGGGPAQMAP